VYGRVDETLPSANEARIKLTRSTREEQQVTTSKLPPPHMPHGQLMNTDVKGGGERWAVMRADEPE
jgi:hypothetical protein